MPLDPAADLCEALSNMVMVGEIRDWLMLGAPGAMCDRDNDGGRLAYNEWLRPRPRFTLTLDNGGVVSSFMRGLDCALEVERRRRSLSGVPATWSFVLIARRDFLVSLKGGRATGGGVTSKRGPGLPLGERRLAARVKSRLRDDAGEEGVVDPEDTERGMATVHWRDRIMRR